MVKSQIIEVKLNCSGDVNDYERLITVKRIAEIINQARKQGKWKKLMLKNSLVSISTSLW
ncbi:MAG: hypothetical protein NT099_06920 [Candidatus Saganbacteria bacterium]|nr:hypothetical protein [Candidatus Saganbacteria bacterium]